MKVYHLDCKEIREPRIQNEQSQSTLEVFRSFEAFSNQFRLEQYGSEREIPRG